MLLKMQINWTQVGKYKFDIKNKYKNNCKNKNDLWFWSALIIMMISKSAFTFKHHLLR